MDAKLTESELQRYSRQLVLRNFGKEKQLKLKAGAVLVVGAGGLGSSALLALAAAGIGKIGIADFDEVSLSNLQRQILYRIDDIGKNKTVAAIAHLKQLNPETNYVSYPCAITTENIMEIMGDYDIVLDGTDNFPTRYLLNDACVLAGKPLVYGSILEFEGQVAVFNYPDNEGTYSTNYRDLFPEPPSPNMVPNCEQSGVLGVLPGIIGNLQSNEVIKIMTGIATPLKNQLSIVDTLRMEWYTVNIPNRNARANITALINYENFCGINPENNKYLGMKDMTVEELNEMKEAGDDFQLIDVREPYERDICHIEGELIPMAQIPGNVDKIDREKMVILYCRSGRRSADMIEWLEKTHGFENLYNLRGGIIAWANEIDLDMPTY